MTTPGPAAARAVEIVGWFPAAESACCLGGDADALRALLTDYVAWHIPARHAIAGDYRADVSDTPEGRAGRRGRRHRRLVTDSTAIVRGVQRRWSTVGLYQIRQQRLAAMPVATPAEVHRSRSATQRAWAIHSTCGP
jgi:hypothetical protein